MRIPFLLSILGSAVMLVGCANSKPVEIGLIDRPDVYNDRMLDALGGQRYTEQQMIYMRKIDQYEHELEQIDEKRRALEDRLALNQLEAGAGSISASDDEASRISEFANATYETQSRLAQENADREAQQALIENERDRRLMEAELEANRRLAELVTGTSLNERELLEKKRIEAEAARHKALVEDEADRKIRDLKERYRLKIQESITTDSAARQADKSHKINMALASAQSERRVREEMLSVGNEINQLEESRDNEIHDLEIEIEDLKGQIRRLEGQARSVREGYDARIALETTKLNQLGSEAKSLIEMSHSLLASNDHTTGDSIPGSLTHQLESELEQEINRVKESIDSQHRLIDQRLERQLSSLGFTSSGETDSSLVKLRENEVLTELASKKVAITNEARTAIASLKVKSEFAKAQVVAPVVTSRAVYSGDYSAEPKAFAVKPVSSREERVVSATTPVKPAAPKKPSNMDAVASKGNATPATLAETKATPDVEPIRVIAKFKPNHNRTDRQIISSSVVSSSNISAGNAKPLMIAPQATTYNVIYRYSEKGSAEKYQRFLEAWGVTDFSYAYSSALGEHILLMGKYTDQAKALSRAESLKKLTSTAPEIVERDL